MLKISHLGLMDPLDPAAKLQEIQRVQVQVKLRKECEMGWVHRLKVPGPSAEKQEKERGRRKAYRIKRLNRYVTSF